MNDINECKKWIDNLVQLAIEVGAINENEVPKTTLFSDTTLTSDYIKAVMSGFYDAQLSRDDLRTIVLEILKSEKTSIFYN